MFSLCKNFININGDLFQIKKVLKEEFMIGKDLDVLKTWYGVDSVYKKDDLLYFCIKINELEIVN
jgi:hypothetical protein